MTMRRIAACFVDRFIHWARSKAPHVQGVVTFAGDDLFDRYEFLRVDEWPDHFWDDHKAECEFRRRGEACSTCEVRPRSLPWWCPINAFVHHWKLGTNTPESWHDHPRWSVTVCLKGRIIERTPWGARLLRPGSIVIRSHRSIHAFEVPERTHGEVWTLFIVGRRKHRQNSYEVTAR